MDIKIRPTIEITGFKDLNLCSRDCQFSDENWDCCNLFGANLKTVGPYYDYERCEQCKAAEVRD
jgi:hypothetical protein